MGKLIAFHGDSAVKLKFTSRVIVHALADEIIKGKYWDNGKGCAVGCTIHGSDHFAYEKELGIPVELAVLQDALFEALPNDQAKSFPLEFLEAIPVGADLKLVWSKFQHWLLVDPERGVVNVATEEQTKNWIRTVAVLFERDAQEQKCTALELQEAEKAAWAAWDARDAWAARAAWAAWDARDAWAARAAWAAWDARAARDAWAAWAARAARAARDAWAARAAWAAWDARDARDARDASIENQACLQRTKLLELLRAAPVPGEQIAA